MEIVISALHYAWNSMAECLEEAVRLGLDGVELSWDHGFARPHCTRADLAELPALRENLGSRLVAHVWDNLAWMGVERGGEALRGWLELARWTGVEALVIHGGSWPDRREGIQRTRQALAGVLGEFERAGMKIYLENHYAWEYRDCQELFSEPWEITEVFSLDSPALGFCFDTGHGHMTRNWRELLSELAPWLRHVHLADNDGVDDDHQMFGRGTVPWDAMLAAIRATGFDGTWCVEFPVREDKRPLRECLAALRRSAEE